MENNLFFTPIYLGAPAKWRLGMEKYFLFEESLKESSLESCLKAANGYVAVMDHEAFSKRCEEVGFGIDIDFTSMDESSPIFLTKAEVNYDSLTGTFAIPNREDLFGDDFGFHFVLDEKGIVFIDTSGYVERVLEIIKATKKWRYPSLERFIFDFLECSTKNDLALLENIENEMDTMEDAILAGEAVNVIEKSVDIRGALQVLRVHYEQLQDLCQELLENENHFFSEENLRYFRNFFDRVDRLMDIVSALREQTIQLRDLFNFKQEEKQNRLMTILTVIATIFMPITLMTGWYGMNFKYMPELEYRYAYVIFAGVALLISIVSIIVMKIKKWL